MLALRILYFIMFKVNMLFKQQAMDFFVLSFLSIIIPVQSLPTVRLAGGSDKSNGRVEIFHRGEWGTICDDQWDNWDADVVCRMLKYSGGTADHGRRYGPGSGRTWFKNVNCLGNETSIDQCIKTYWTENDCDHSRDAGVVCNSVWRFGKNVTGWKTIGCNQGSFIITNDPKICPDAKQICDNHYLNSTIYFCLKNEYKKPSCIEMTRDTLIDQTGCYIGKEQNKFQLRFPVGPRKWLHIFLLEKSIEYTDINFKTKRRQPFLNLKAHTDGALTVDGDSWILVKYTEEEIYADFFSMPPDPIAIKGKTEPPTTTTRTESTLSVKKRQTESPTTIGNTETTLSAEKPETKSPTAIGRTESTLSVLKRETKSLTTVTRTESTLSVQKHCPDGMFGEGCSQICNCKEQKYCHELIKFCGIDGCRAGYQGLDCQKSCPVGTFGDGCFKTCNCQNINDCDNINGTCWPGGCVAYYDGYNCQEFNFIIVIACSSLLIILIVVIPAICFMYCKFMKSKALKKSKSRSLPEIPRQNGPFTAQANMNALNRNDAIVWNEAFTGNTDPDPTNDGYLLPTQYDSIV